MGTFGYLLPGQIEELHTVSLSLFPSRQATFVKWYLATHNKKPAKRPAEAAAGAAPAAKKPALAQTLLPGASAAAAPAMSASKAKALLKGIVTSAKASAKAKRWHQGDAGDLTGASSLNFVPIRQPVASYDPRPSERVCQRRSLRFATDLLPSLPPPVCAQARP